MHIPGKQTDPRVAKMVKQLRSDDEHLRAEAALRLTTAGHEVYTAIPQLQQSLLDADPQVRRLAAWCLSRLGQASRAAA